MTDEDVRELGKQLPWDRPDVRRREAVRSSLLVAAAEGTGGRTNRSWWMAGGGFVAGLAAAAVAILVVGRRPVDPPAQPHASIEASAQANFERELTKTTTGTDEVVHLHAGRLRLSVGALATGDHMRVHSGDTDVEAAGDVEVAVEADALREVAVRTGTARISVAGQPARFLAAGETWHPALLTATIEPPAPVVPAPSVTTAPPAPSIAPSPPAASIATAPPAPSIVPAPPAPSIALATPTAAPHVVPVAPAPATAGRAGDRAPAIAVAPRVAPTRAPEPAAPPEPVVADAPAAKASHHAAIEQAFQAGYALLRAGKADEAATALAAAADLDPDDPLAVDARYFAATALVKARHPAEAERALLAFLDHARSSLRRGRASVLLGRLIADRGDAKSARTWFEAALQSADPEAVAAARAGLAALH